MYFKIKISAKIFALSDKHEINLGRFMMELLRFSSAKKLDCNFQELAGNKFLVFSRDSFSLFPESLALITN